MTWFRFGMRTSWDAPVSMLEEYPISARNINTELAQVTAANCIISNCSTETISIRNFDRISKNEYSFSRTIFRNMLEHMHKAGLVEWSGFGLNSSAASQIKYRAAIFRYLPENSWYEPPGTIILKEKRMKRGINMLPGKNKEKILLDRQIRSYWNFVKQHEIDHNLSKETFGIIAAWKMAIGDKTEKANFPDKRMICPVAVFNNRSLSIGGRFYRAFWIGMPSEARRFITIDGELTADIDGKSMHVQLLYQKAGIPVPDEELYIYPKSDPRRKIAKRLMLYMMNTRKKWEIKQGRVAVIKTYRKHHTVEDGTDLMDTIVKLEKLHKPIHHLLYQSNWGRLQCTEAGIMLKIMLAGMEENILVLPVHDGCLCQRKHKGRVLELFADQGILAEENAKHLEPLNLDKIRKFYDLEQKEIELKKERQIEIEKQRQKAETVPQLTAWDNIHTENLGSATNQKKADFKTSKSQCVHNRRLHRPHPESLSVV